jgi:hypothetical protein
MQPNTLTRREYIGKIYVNNKKNYVGPEKNNFESTTLPVPNALGETRMAIARHFKFASFLPPKTVSGLFFFAAKYSESIMIKDRFLRK